MIQVSEFSSLNFRDDWKLGFQQNVEYVQRFLPTDKIRIQYITDDKTVLPYLTNHTTGEIKQLSPSVVFMSGSLETYDVVIEEKEESYFTLSFRNDNEILLESSFEICVELPDTILLEYTNRRNTLDTIFSEDRFSFRVEGVFLPQEIQFTNETEDFRDQRFHSKLLSSTPYEQKKLTIGGAFGVPNWVARKINYIFSLSSVHVDGKTMVRSEGSAIEGTIIGNFYPMYLYKITLEESEEYEENS